ncbi:MAG: hypothetical protein ACJ71T_08625 [Actinomycetales bacterium]
MTPDVTGLSATLPTALPPDAVLAHVGMHKTGTTAIQSVMTSLRHELRPAGVTYPGSREAHHVEARSLTQAPLGWQSSPVPPPDPSLWDQFVATVHGTPGRVVFSSEFFTGADQSAIRRMAADLGDRAHFLIGVRNLGPVAVSSWQQTLKQGRISTLDAWLKGNFQRDSADDTEKFFWARFDPAAAVSRYAAGAGPERVTVVVLREGDRALLPTTFERLLDLPEGRLAGQSVPRSNRGLTVLEAEALRQVNVALRGKLDWQEYDVLVRNGAIRRMVENRTPKPDEPKPEVPEWIREQVAREGRRVADSIRASGVRVVGDLADLSAVPATSGASLGSDQATVPLDAMVEAIVGAVAGATYGSWSFDDERRVRALTVAQTPARTLAGVLASRLGGRAGRILRRR